jgi:hypothetical protein
MLFRLAGGAYVMALSAFDNKDVAPDEQSLAAMLGRTSELWLQLTDSLRSDCGPLREEWRFAGPKFGWSCRLQEPKRTLVYLTPCRGSFLASFALGERACAAARAAGLPASILALIDAAPRYPEGRGVRIPVRRRSDVDAVRRLAAIKHAR